MFILRKKGTNKYVSKYNCHTHGNKTFTTNINEAETYVNLDDIDRVCSEYDSKSRTWISYFSDEFDILEVEIKIKRSIDNVRRK